MTRRDFGTALLGAAAVGAAIPLLAVRPATPPQRVSLDALRHAD